MFFSFACNRRVSLNTDAEDVFDDRVSLTSHRTFINRDVVGFYENSVRRYLHAFNNADDIAHQNQVLMNLECSASSPDSHPLLFICHGVQFDKLPFLLVIVSCGNEGAHCHCDQNGESFEPSCFSVFWVCQTDLQAD